MHIVAGRQLRHRRFLAKRLQRDLRRQLSRITPSLPWHSRLLLLGLDPTLASCPNSGVHLYTPAYSYLASGDIIMSGMAGGDGGTVNLRRERSTFSFSDAFILRV